MPVLGHLNGMVKKQAMKRFPIMMMIEYVLVCLSYIPHRLFLSLVWFQWVLQSRGSYDWLRKLQHALRYIPRKTPSTMPHKLKLLATMQVSW